MAKLQLEVQATAWRELAKRAKRLAGTLLDDPARDRLLKYSAELEQTAVGLEDGGVSQAGNTEDNPG